LRSSHIHAAFLEEQPARSPSRLRDYDSYLEQVKPFRAG
jgi:hypothetical protein